jgi:hypothetical protein
MQQATPFQLERHGAIDVLQLAYAGYLGRYHGNTFAQYAQTRACGDLSNTVEMCVAMCVDRYGGVMTEPTMGKLLHQFAAVVRALPGYVLGAPTRLLLRIHAPEDVGTGVAMCLRHRWPVEWPCREWLDADAALLANPRWRP